jgi:UDP-glucose 4-epimerase
MSTFRILLTGGVGFIGSHTLVELINLNIYEIHIVDNLCNSSLECLTRVEKICEMKPNSIMDYFHKIDLCDRDALEQLFSEFRFDVVIHFASLKAVGESVSHPLLYYRNNLISTIVLLETMEKYNCRSIIFSSSATVYGNPQTVPITEQFPVQGISNPYGKSKAMIEDIISDLAIAKPEWKVIILRYFNPIGAHASGLIGEDPKGIPNNLFPFITRVAVGKCPQLSIFGNNYPTIDGTGVRDYIHVVDLAKGHVAALKLFLDNWCGTRIFNLGRGEGCSVLQLIDAFQKSTGIKIPYKFVDKRPGDIAICYCDPFKAESELDWKATKNIYDMCIDGWRWQSKNPNGFNR